MNRPKVLSCAASVLALLLVLSNTAQADIGDNEVGVNVHVPWRSLHLIEKAQSLNVGWIRVDGNWELFEGRSDAPDVPPERWSPQAPYNESSYTWDVMDSVVCEAARRDLKVYMTLAYTPCWAIEGGGVNCNDPNRGFVGYRKPIRGKYEAFVFAAVRHYSQGIDCGGQVVGRVTHFGMWNEANLDHFYQDSDVADYVDRLLIPGARAVRAACPQCKVLGPDLATVDGADDSLEEVLCNPQGRDAIDILAHHSYNNFEALGHFIWDGDSYDNVLDEQRFAWTRRSLRQVMETCQAGDMEVWMTETGRRAPGQGPPNNPSFDQDELQEQARYIELTFEAQARRPWITNTFVYEIVDDTLSDIDGYGLWRCDQSNGFRQEPCFEKPAADAIRNFLAEHPEFGDDPGPALPACSNGIDDDADGLTDHPDDPGCQSPQDDDEFNAPPPRTLEVPQAPSLSIDGNGDEYGDDGRVILALADFETLEAPDGLPSPQDLSAIVRVRRVGDRLGFFIEVLDDTHDNPHNPEGLWQGDSLQLALDPNGSGGDAYQNGDTELGIALLNQGPQTIAFFGQRPAGMEGPVIVREAGQTRYEFSLPIQAVFGTAQPRAGDAARASLLINEADGQGREGWLGFGAGIGRAKRPDNFARFELVDRIDDPNGPNPMPDAGPDMDTSNPQDVPNEPGEDAQGPAPDAEQDTADNPDAPISPDVPDEQDAAGQDSPDEDNNGNNTPQPSTDTPSEGCQSAPGQPGWPALSLLLLLWILRRRRLQARAQ